MFFHVVVRRRRRSDGSFSVDVPAGSYDVEVSHHNYAFPSVRVEVSSKGAIRARKLDNIRQSKSSFVVYPLRFKATGLVEYFEQRQQSDWTSNLSNPMVLIHSVGRWRNSEFIISAIVYKCHSFNTSRLRNTKLGGLHYLSKHSYSTQYLTMLL